MAWCIDGGSDGATCKSINSKEEGTPLKHIQDTFGENVTVSFPTKEQIESADGSPSPEYRLISQWLYDNMTSSRTYWTSSLFVSSSEGAYIVSYSEYGAINSNRVAGENGLRPVITVSKSNLN